MRLVNSSIAEAFDSLDSNLRRLPSHKVVVKTNMQEYETETVNRSSYFSSSDEERPENGLAVTNEAIDSESGAREEPTSPPLISSLHEVEINQANQDEDEVLVEVNGEAQEQQEEHKLECRETNCELKVDTDADETRFEQNEAQSSSEDEPSVETREPEPELRRFNEPPPVRPITPPREEERQNYRNSRDESPERDPNIVRSSIREEVIEVEPEITRSLTAKFEKWSVESDRPETKRNSELANDKLPDPDITKNLRAKFEAIQDENSREVEKPKGRPNRFVCNTGLGAGTETCSVCEKRLYPMEKMEFSGVRIHKSCFRCAHCSSSLRLDSYTTSAGKMYCMPHSKPPFVDSSAAKTNG